MENNMQHFRHILLFYYREGKNAIQARKKLTDACGEDVLTVPVPVSARNGLRKFRSGNVDVEDALRSGRPVEADKVTLMALVDANRPITTRAIGERLNLSNPIVYDHSKGLGLTSRLDIWVSHALTERKCRCVDSIITEGEKWVVYNNVKRKRSRSKEDEPAQSISKANIHKKMLLSDNTTINSEVYCHQLDKLNDALQQKKPELINRKGVVVTT
ncbi:histone-lysine N-methyltransferase SETMAR-like, partial [Augochlora pura]